MANEGIIKKTAGEKITGRKPATLQDYIKRMEGEIAKALPAVITPERFTRMVMSAVSSNPKLGECTPQSFLGAMMQAAQLGVEPNTPLGQAYLIPYKNHGTMECQFQLGYKGMIDLAYRSGDVSIIQAHAVYENDEFEYALGLEPKLVHKPAKADRGEPVFFYAMFRTKDGGYGFDVMSIDDIRNHARRYSKSYSNGPWQTNFEEMAKKTVLKRTLKYAPLKSDFVRAVAADESIKTEIAPDMGEIPNEYVDADFTVDDDTGEIVDHPSEEQEE
ncbi:MAG: recombinase RecT [Oscillospiraceae bacterium]|jgi:recombination protein RecT